MKLPSISPSRWALNSNGDVYRSDGYVGIGTDAPGGLLGLKDENTFITVNSDNEIIFQDVVSGTQKLSDLARTSSAIGETNEAIHTILKDLDGYVQNQTVTENKNAQEQINQSVLQALDAYGAGATEGEHYNQQQQINQSILQSLDGYALTVDLQGLDTTVQENKNAQQQLNQSVLQALDAYGAGATEGEHYNQQQQINQSVLQALDAYQSITQEALTFAVDYNLGGAATIPTGTIFSKQIQISNFLTNAGTTSFKYLREVYDAVPRTIYHAVTINLAAGIHRPGASENAAAFRLGRKTFISGLTIGSMTIAGQLPASYTTVVAAQTITAFQVASNDPYLDFAGTPFTSGALKGLTAVLSTGQSSVIHDNTTSRLNIMTAISPSPTVGVSTCIVAQPSVTLRNSITDLARAYASFIVRTGNGPSDAAILFQDLLLDPFGNSSISITNASGTFTRCIFDRSSSYYAFPGCPRPNATGYSIVSGTLSLVDSSIIDIPDATPGWADDPILLQFCPNCVLQRSYISGGEVGLTATHSRVRWFDVVSDGCGTGVSGRSRLGIHIFENSVFELSILGGKLNEIRNTIITKTDPSQASPGVVYLIGSHCNGGGMSGGGSQGLIFKNNNPSTTGAVGAMIRLAQNSTFDLSNDNGATGIQDGGGNIGVGWDLVGPNASLLIGSIIGTSSSVTTVTGNSGDVRFSDGTIMTYADITSEGPVVDPASNYAVRI